MDNADKKVISNKGKLYGLGIGPGDPELLTLKAVRILKDVDFVFAPRASIKAESVAANIIKDIIPDNKIITMVFPMTKDISALEKFWQDAAKRVYGEILKGSNVAFVTLGDPLIYSTYIYLIRNIRLIDETIEIETIPGISSINAAAAIGEFPLAESEEKVAVLPLPRQIEELKSYFDEFDTVVIMKIGKSLDRLVAFLAQEGLEDSAFFASRIGYKDQYTVKGLKQIKKGISGYLSTMIIRTDKAKKV